MTAMKAMKTMKAMKAMKTMKAMKAVKEWLGELLFHILQGRQVNFPDAVFFFPVADGFNGGDQVLVPVCFYFENLKSSQ